MIFPKLSNVSMYPFMSLCKKFFPIRNISVKLRFKTKRADAPLLDSNELTRELGLLEKC